MDNRMWSDPLHFIALGFGAGLSPIAPGTMGSLVGLLLYLLIPLNLHLQLALIIFAFFIGIWVCDVVGRDLNDADHPSIVWDEIVGVWIALIALPRSWWIILLAFALFRLFDIWKPWPISWCQQKLLNGIGVMLDDVLAGAAANMLIWIFLMVISKV